LLLVPALTQVRLACDKRRKRRCRGYGFVRFCSSEQANAAVQGMSSFEFQKGCFLHALPSDENRTLFVGGLTESWDLETVKAVLMRAFPNMRRYEHAFGVLSLYRTQHNLRSTALRPCIEPVYARYKLWSDCSHSGVGCWRFCIGLTVPWVRDSHCRHTWYPCVHLYFADV
jgi:RNA recognition motif. (a.k.a. RRM, RBD, or RNP domain)